MGSSIYKKEYQDVIKRLREARFESGLKQKEAAARLGKPQSYISKIERGERRLDVAEIKLFAKIYKKPVSFFVK